MAKSIINESDVCCKCGLPIGYKYHRNQRVCVPCALLEPYDFTYIEGNCKIQVHTELMSKTQLTKLISGLGKIRNEEKKNRVCTV